MGDQFIVKTGIYILSWLTKINCVIISSLMECSLWSRYSLWCFKANSFNSHTVRKLKSLFLFFLSCSVMSNSLQYHGLYSPWTSPGQNTEVGSLSLLQLLFPTQGLNAGLPHCWQILYQLSHKGAPIILILCLQGWYPKWPCLDSQWGKKPGWNPGVWSPEPVLWTGSSLRHTCLLQLVLHIS